MILFFIIILSRQLSFSQFYWRVIPEENNSDHAPIFVLEALRLVEGTLQN